MRSRVVGGDDDEPALHARVCRAKQRVRCDVQSHLFHGDGGAQSRPTGGERHFKRHLLVDRPLRVHVAAEAFFIFDDPRQNFRTWRARVGGHHAAPLFHHPQSDRFVSSDQLRGHNPFTHRTQIPVPDTTGSCSPSISGGCFHPARHFFLQGRSNRQTSQWGYSTPTLAPG